MTPKELTAILEANKIKAAEAAAVAGIASILSRTVDGMIDGWAEFVQCLSHDGTDESYCAERFSDREFPQRACRTCRVNHHLSEARRLLQGLS
jgi:hypothetical protein